MPKLEYLLNVTKTVIYSIYNKNIQFIKSSLLLLSTNWYENIEISKYEEVLSGLFQCFHHLSLF